MSAPLLEAQDLTIRFSGLTAVDSVSLVIPEKQVRGLIGPNGAGKTTFFNAITGLVTPDSGRIVFGGTDITGIPAHRRAIAGMRRTFQSIQLIPQLTVLENVLIGLHQRIGDNPVASVLGLPRGSRAELAAQAEVQGVLDFLGIGWAILERVSALTFVQQRFVEIARAIVTKPRLLMLDEPAAGLSPSDVETLDALIRRLRAEWGMSILLVEHVISLVLGICDEVTVLDKGRLISEGAPAAVANDPKVKIAYLGEDDAGAP